MASLPAPENANLKAEPTAAQQRGALVFQKAACGSCHSGKWFTNDAIVDVGTLTPTDNGVVTTQGLNVPSLRGLARTAPYLHDGSAETLHDRVVEQPGRQARHHQHAHLGRGGRPGRVPEDALSRFFGRFISLRGPLRHGT